MSNAMTETVTENKMGVMPIRKLLFSMALPMMISMMVQALYNIVDSIFVAQICEDALTAVSMAFPMQNLLIGLASGIGVGTNALLSRALGKKDGKEATNMAMQGLLLSLIGYLIFLALGLTITRVFFELQGASRAITEYGVEYLSVVMIFSFGVFFQILLERILAGTGRTIYTMITQGSGAIINIILDPILIFGLVGMPKLGIRGAAVATVIGQIVAAILALIFNLLVNKEIRLSFKGFRPSGRRILQILIIGIPSVIMVAIGSVMTFLVNKILGVFSSTAVAVFGVCFKLQSIAFMPVFGLNNAMVPIVAYNLGAKKRDRMEQCRKHAIIFAVIIMVIFVIVIQSIPAQLLLIFNASATMLDIGIPALRIISLSFLVAGFCIVCSSYFQALGKSVYSMMISIIRQLLFLVPLAFVFSKTGNLDMVWLSWPLAEIASVVTCIVLHRKVQKGLDQMLEEI